MINKRTISIILTFIVCVALSACSSNSQHLSSSTSSSEISPVIDHSVLSAIFDAPATMYSEDVAKVAAYFCQDSEESVSKIKESYIERGLSCIETYYYEENPLSPSGGASAIGHLRMDINGDAYTLIVITARGTKTFGEAVGDYFKGGSVSYIGNYVFKNVYDFEEKITEAVQHYVSKYPAVLETNNIKILITGHSLGGAAANLYAAKLDYGLSHGGILSNMISKEDIYCYSYNAISVFPNDILSTGANIEEGYENIHNIYNYYDSFGPNGTYSFLLASSPYAKYGHTHFYYSHDSETRFSFTNHTNYATAVEKGKVEKTCPAISSYAFDVGTTIIPGTYISTDGFYQSFTFSNGNKVKMSAFGLSGDGTYEIQNGTITIHYIMLGSKLKWTPTFSQDGGDLIIAGTRFVRQ